MKNGWKNAWKWIKNGWTMGRRCSKKSCSKDFGLPSTKNQHLGAKLGMTRTFAILGEEFVKISCAWKPILCSVSQTCFDWQARCFVTCQLLILSSPNEMKVQKLGVFAGYVNTSIFRIPRRFPKGHSMFQSVTIYIYKSIYIYINKYYIYIYILYTHLLGI